MLFIIRGRPPPPLRKIFGFLVFIFFDAFPNVKRWHVPSKVPKRIRYTMTIRRSIFNESYNNFEEGNQIVLHELRMYKTVYASTQLPENIIISLNKPVRCDGSLRKKRLKGFKVLQRIKVVRGV